MNGEDVGFTNFAPGEPAFGDKVNSSLYRPSCLFGYVLHFVDPVTFNDTGYHPFQAVVIDIDVPADTQNWFGSTKTAFVDVIVCKFPLKDFCPDAETGALCFARFYRWLRNIKLDSKLHLLLVPMGSGPDKRKARFWGFWSCFR